MPDDQKAIVQRMIDAGESEDNIATVIQHFKQAATPALPGGTRAYAAASARGDDPNAPPSPLLESLGHLAHPQTYGDMAGLLIPSGAGGAIADALKPAGAAISKYGGAAAKVIGTAATSLIPSSMVAPLRGSLRVLGELKPSEWNNPLTVAGREGRAVAASRAFNDLPLAEQMKQLPTNAQMPVTMRTATPPYQAPTPPAVAAPPETAALQAPTAGGLSAADKAELLKNHYPPELIQRIDQANAPIKGTLRTAPSVPEVSPLRQEELLQTFGGRGAPVASHPLQAPRVQQGAEAVGRQSGMTKQAVRDLTGPIGGEAQGAAADVVPTDPFNRMHDKILAMGPNALNERTAYANAARDEKTRGQLLSIVRTLSRNGLAVPLVAGGVPASEMLRQALLRRLSTGANSGGP